MKEDRVIWIAYCPAGQWERPLYKWRKMTRRQYLAFWRKECVRCDMPYDRDKYSAMFEDLYVRQNPTK